MAISERLKSLREKTGLSQEEFAASVGLKRANYAQIELGKQNPTIETLTEIVRIYNNEHSFVTYEWLIEGKKPKKESSKQVLQEPVVHLTKEVIKLPKIITVDQHGKENILLVPVRARAGYLSGYGDADFISHLPSYRLPGMSNGTFRMFEVEGLSMNPTLNDKDILITQFVERIDQIRDDRIYVILTKHDGIVVKRVLNRSKENKLILKSDNYKHREDYPTIVIDVEDVLELWYGYAVITRQMKQPAEVYTRLADLEGRMALMESGLKHLKSGK